MSQIKPKNESKVQPRSRSEPSQPARFILACIQVARLNSFFKPSETPVKKCLTQIYSSNMLF